MNDDEDSSDKRIFRKAMSFFSLVFKAKDFFSSSSRRIAIG
jgi:hypothetical protein